MPEFLISNFTEISKRSTPTYSGQSGPLIERVSSYKQNEVGYIQDVDNLKPKNSLQDVQRLRYFTTMVIYEPGIKAVVLDNF